MQTKLQSAAVLLSTFAAALSSAAPVPAEANFGWLVQHLEGDLGEHVPPVQFAPVSPSPPHYSPGPQSNPPTPIVTPQLQTPDYARPSPYEGYGSSYTPAYSAPSPYQYQTPHYQDPTAHFTPGNQAPTAPGTSYASPYAPPPSQNWNQGYGYTQQTQTHAYGGTQSSPGNDKESPYSGTGYYRGTY